jgi:peptidyl-prolyl cis-trans isomerase D
MISKAFESKQGDPPQFATTGEGYAVFQVTGVAAAHAPAFADWKAKVTEDYRDERLPILLSQKTAELAAKAKSSNDLAKAAKEMGATVKTSDLVGQTGQVPDLGQVGQVAPQLFDMTPGAISGPINAQRTGVVAKLVDKQEPTVDEIAKNYDQMRDQILEERRSEAFNVFSSTVFNDYKKKNRIRLNAKAQSSEAPGE